MNPLVLLCLVALASSAAHAQALTIVTAEHAPANFERDGRVTGASTEQVRRIMAAIGQSYDIEILPWARAYRMAESQANTCVYTTGHSAERSKRFKWVEPLLVDRIAMVRVIGSNAKPATLEDAKAFSIGTQRDDVAEDVLIKNGFPRIDVAARFDLTLKKLLSGRIDLMMSSETVFKTLKSQGVPVEATLVFTGMNYGLACNRAVSDDLIAKMQAELDRLIADGTQDRIFAEYGMNSDR